MLLGLVQMSSSSSRPDHVPCPCAGMLAAPPHALSKPSPQSPCRPGCGSCSLLILEALSLSMPSSVVGDQGYQVHLGRK